MTTRKVLFWLWGGIYWPFLALAMLFGFLMEVFGEIGGWLHDLLLDWAYPLPTVYVRDSQEKKEKV